MKRNLLFGILLMLMVWGCSTRERSTERAADADPENVPSLVGEYAVNGFDPLGQEYGGRLTITTTGQSGTYNMQWIIVGSIQKGVGVLKGNHLQVVWQSVESSTSQSRGTATYTVTEAGELYGTRNVDGYSNEGTEQAFPNQ